MSHSLYVEKIYLCDRQRLWMIGLFQREILPPPFSLWISSQFYNERTETFHFFALTPLENSRFFFKLWHAFLKFQLLLLSMTLEFSVNILNKGVSRKVFMGKNIRSRESVEEKITIFIVQFNLYTKKTRKASHCNIIIDSTLHFLPNYTKSVLKITTNGCFKDIFLWFENWKTYVYCFVL